MESAHIYVGDSYGKNTATKMTSYMNSHLGGPEHDANRVWQTGAFGYHKGGDLMERAEGLMSTGSYGNFTKDSWDRFYEAGGTGNPLIDTNPNDISAILELYGTDTFNPYTNRDETVAEGSVADVMYGLTKNNLGIRGNVWRALRNDRHLGSTRMNERMWNQYGFNDSIGNFGDYIEKEANPFDRTNTGPSNPFSSSGGDVSSRPGLIGNGMTDTGGGFMDAFKRRREELGNKPSVMSLFKEMEGYENE